MKLIKKIKDWRDRRFQKRVFKALCLDKTMQTGYIQPCDPHFLQADGNTMQGRIVVAAAPTLEIDEIHNVDSGVPV